MVPSLDAFSEYHLTVLAYNSKGAGPESEPYIFQTPEGGERINVEGAIYANYPMVLLNIPFIIDSKCAAQRNSHFGFYKCVISWRIFVCFFFLEIR